MLRAFGLIRRDPLAFLCQVRAQHGGVVQFPIPRPATYLVSDPDAVRHVLVGNARAYGKRTQQYTTLALVTGQGLLTADTDVWRDRRRIVQPAFHHSAVALVGDHVATALQRVDTRWSAATSRGAAVVDVDAAMMHAALEIVGHALFGSDLSHDAERLAAATLQALDVVVARARNPLSLPARIPTPGNVRLASSVSRLDAAVEVMLRERDTRPLGDGEAPRDMLDLLLADNASSREQIRDEIVTFIVAGHETVASALTWSWHLLGNNPIWQEALKAEALAVVGSERWATFDDLSRLPVARAIYDETLRLYPPAWLVTRRSLEPDRLAGVDIPADALVIMSPWIVHRDENAWCDPEVFDPQRFLAADASGGTTHVPVREAYFPFGAGPRLCIGREMALLEGVLMLSGLAARYRFTPGPGPAPRAVPLVTVRPDAGLPMWIERRA